MALVRNITVPSYYSGLNVVDYGVVGDGSSDDTVAYTRTVEAANALQLPVYVPPGMRVRITGSSNITHKYGFNFNGSTLDIQEYAGKFLFQRQVAPVQYSAGSPLLTALASTTLSGTYNSVMSGRTELDNCYVNIVTNQPYYTYRGTVTTRTERLAVIRNGMLDGTLKYPLAGSRITGITAYPLPDKEVVYENVVVDVGANQLQGNPFLIEADKVRLENWSFKQSNVLFTSVNPVYVVMRNCFHVRVRNFQMQWTTRTAANNFTYGVAAEYCSDIEFDSMKGVGDGWGMTGFNENRRCTFRNCQLSRIDTHQPFIEWLRVLDCDTGQWGISLTALGDVIVKGGSITLTNDSVYTDKVGFILLRNECGGVLDGQLVVDGVTLKNYTSTTTQALVYHRGDLADAPPSGSPVNFQCSSSMLIKNLRSDDRIVELAPTINGASGIKYPASIVVQDCIEGIYSFATNISTFTPNSTITTPVDNALGSISNLKVQLRSCNIRSNVSLVDTSVPQKFVVDMLLDGVFGNGAFNPGLQVKFGGTVSCINSVLEGLDFFSGTALDRYLKVSVVGGGIRHTGRFRTVPVNGANTLVSVIIQGSALQSTTAAALRSYMVAHLQGCTYSVAGSTSTTTLTVTPDGSTSYDTGVVGINSKNLMQLTASVSGVLRRAPFFLPASGGSTYVQLDQGVYANVTYNGSTVAVSTTAGLGGITLVG